MWLFLCMRKVRHCSLWCSYNRARVHLRTTCGGQQLELGSGRQCDNGKSMDGRAKMDKVDDRE